MADIAVITTGGKQYIVQKGTKLKVEKLEAEAGQEVVFDRVLMADSVIGTPEIAGAKVTAKVVEQGKGKKLVIFHFKPKKREKKRTGHRQKYTEVEILKIES